MTISEDLDLVRKGRPDNGSYNDTARQNYDMAMRRVRGAVLEGELARTDAEAIREVMLEQARTIAGLQAENERLKHAPVTGSTGWSIPPTSPQPDFVGLDKPTDLD